MNCDELEQAILKKENEKAYYESQIKFQEDILQATEAQIPTLQEHSKNLFRQHLIADSSGAQKTFSDERSRVIKDLKNINKIKNKAETAKDGITLQLQILNSDLEDLKTLWGVRCSSTEAKEELEE